MMGGSNWVPFCVWLILGLAMILTVEGSSAPSPSPSSSPSAPPKRAFFVFGDSLVDNGNNNYLVTVARADSPPYGIDFPTHKPTGRFCNGLNIPDILSQQIGLESPMPYLNPNLTGQKLLAGANFASAGIGILDDTGIQFVNIVRISQQLEYFEQYQQRLRAVIGGEKTKELVNQSVVLISVGGNDFVNNYFLVPFSLRSFQFTLPQFVNYLISKYQKVLQRLYDMGARKVVVTGTGPLGCSPAELGLWSKDGECAAELQQAASLYNPKLVRMVNALNRKIGTHVFIAANAHEIHMDFITNPQPHGFITSKVACCGQGPYNGLGLCTTASALCPNRDLYVFWDPFHPSERANKLIVKQIMAGSTKYMAPVNLSTLMAMD